MSDPVEDHSYFLVVDGEDCCGKFDFEPEIDPVGFDGPIGPLLVLDWFGLSVEPLFLLELETVAAGGAAGVAALDDVVFAGVVVGVAAVVGALVSEVATKSVAGTVAPPVVSY